MYISAVDTDTGLRSYMIGVYNWMMMALVVTGITAYGVSTSATMMSLIHHTYFGFIFMFAPLILVFAYAYFAETMGVASTRMFLAVFAFLMGISLSSIFEVYTGASIARVFFITSATFAAMSLYGYTTKRDLTSLGSFLMMGLVGIIIASIVNIFLASSMLQWIISVIGLGVFILLTAYDTQKIKENYYVLADEKTMVHSALELYLDFINIFIYLIQLIGNKD